ncbi:MAG TPA: ABC transporter permease [Lacunisphaera sp.]|nr:ABC transporter permease [Lacunisphaera sp.]
MRLLRRIGALLRSGRFNAEMRAEMQHHLDLQAERNRAAGMEAEEARFAAEREFGNIASLQERALAQRRWGWLEDLGKDFRFALRLLRKQRGFSAIAVLTLALAIGANSTIFSVVNGFLLRPVVDETTGAYVGVHIAQRDAARRFRPFSHAEFTLLREGNEAFTDVAALSFSQVGLTDEGSLRRAFAFLVSENFFALGGAKPAAGRFFDASETRPNAARHVVIAGYQLWQRHGGRPDFIGSTLRLNGQPYTVIGVTPEGFSGVTAILAPELWLPLGVFGEIVPAFGDSRATSDLAAPANYALNLFARLPPGLTIASAQSRLPPLAARIDALAPGTDRTAHELVLAKPFSISPTPNSSRPLTLVGTLTLAMSTLLMLIASLNLANMLLARGAARATEFAVRLAVGCTRGRIVRQLVVEGLVLALAAGIAGTLLSSWTIRGIQHMLEGRLVPMGFVVTTRLQPDWRVLGFTLLGCIAATLVFSLGPALKSSRVNLVRDLKAQAGLGGESGAWDRLFSGASLLVTVQATLSLVLLFAAGLFLRAALQAAAAPVGFNAPALIVAELDLSLTPASRDASVRRVLAAAGRLRVLPGVRAAGAATLVPFANLSPTCRLAPLSAPRGADNGEAPRSFGGVLGAIAPGFLDSLDVRVIRGRDITAGEAGGLGRSDVCLVDERMAAKLFPGADAIGQRVRLTGAPFGGEMEIVGVVSRHTQDVQDSKEPFPRVYVPLHLGYTPTIFLTASCADGSPLAAARLTGLLRKELLALDPDLPLVGLRPFADHLRDNLNLWQIRLGAGVFGVFGLLALMMASVGIYGVKAYAVSRRTREIGIRMALGADRSGVFGLIMRQSFGQLGFACVVGVGLSLLTGRVLAAYLVGVEPTDPVVLGMAVGCLTLATVAACWLPARCATKVDPMVALRSE